MTLSLLRRIPPCFSSPVLQWKPNARAHLLPEAGATLERTLEAVRCSPMFGAVPAPVLPLPEPSTVPSRVSCASRMVVSTACQATQELLEVRHHLGPVQKAAHVATTG